MPGPQDGGLPSHEQLLASAATFLIEGGNEDAASILLSCSIESVAVVWAADPIDGYAPTRVCINFSGPRVAYDCLSNWRDQDQKRIWSALAAVLPHDYQLDGIEIRATLVENLDPGWHAELLELARRRAVNNQAADAENFQMWNNLRFRSPAEVKIAEALDKAGVLFFPNNKGRLNQGPRRANRESDFLVCHNGKWGILEVDGDAWHTPDRAVQDHERDRLFRTHGVKVVERFSGKHCIDIPDAVVEKFLSILENNG